MKKNKFERKLKKVCISLVILKGAFLMLTPNVYAANNNPLTVVNNLSNFIFDIVQTAGSIMVVFGLIQFGLALKGHDPAQRASSIFTIIGGIIIACSKVILNSIM